MKIDLKTFYKTIKYHPSKWNQDKIPKTITWWCKRRIVTMWKQDDQVKTIPYLFHFIMLTEVTQSCCQFSQSLWSCLQDSGVPWAMVNCNIIRHWKNFPIICFVIIQLDIITLHFTKEILSPCSYKARSNYIQSVGINDRNIISQLISAS